MVTPAVPVPRPAAAARRSGPLRPAASPLPPRAGSGGPADDRDLRAAESRENFPVAMRVLPAELRGHLRALYDVVRTIDDLGDEADGDRTAQLLDLSADLDALAEGRPPRTPALCRYAPTARACDLPVAPLRDLVEANLLDQRVHRYADLDALLGYCRLSADPVGRLVLRVFGVASETTDALSDRVCTALQLLEHLQDVAEDHRAGRVYLPQADLAAFGVGDDDLAAPTSSPALRALVALEVDRAAALLDEGSALVGHLSGWARVAIAGYVAGGLATVDALRRPGADVLVATPRPRRADLFRHLARTAGRRS